MINQPTLLSNAIELKNFLKYYYNFINNKGYKLDFEKLNIHICDSSTRDMLKGCAHASKKHDIIIMIRETFKKFDYKTYKKEIDNDYLKVLLHEMAHLVIAHNEELKEENDHGPNFERIEEILINEFEQRRTLCQP